MGKIISILLGIFMISAFLTSAFGQKELEVMKRYDYSSPKVSFESFKKAIKEEDIEGIVIHMWQINKASEEGTPGYGMSFEDFVAYMTDGRFLTYVKPYTSEQITIMPPKEAILYLFNEFLSHRSSNPLKVTELDFVKEREREHEEGMTTCWIILERKSNGTREETDVVNYDGTNEWWIAMLPGGE